MRGTKKEHTLFSCSFFGERQDEGGCGDGGGGVVLVVEGVVVS